MSLTTKPAGRRRFWLTVLCFALANLAAWIGFIRWESRRHAQLHVASFAPSEGAEIGARSPVSWTFDQEVADAGRMETTPPAVMHPLAPGRWQWQNSRTLTFTPEAELPLATTFSFTLTGEHLISSTGARLEKPFTRSVHTPPLELVDVRQAEFDERDRVVVELRFNDTVLPAEVQQHLHLERETGETMSFRLHGQAAGRSVRFITDMPMTLTARNEAKLLVKLAPGLVGQSGPLGITASYERTLLFSTDLMATGISAAAPMRGDTTLSVSFNNSNVQPDLLKDVLSIEPAVPFTISGGYSGVILHGAFESGKRYAVKIAKAPTHTIGKFYPRPTTLGVLVPERAAGVWFEHTEGYLGSAGHRTLLAHAVNVADLKVTVTRVYDSNLVAWRTSQRRYSGWSVGEGWRRPVASRDLHLKLAKNQPQDIRLSLDELLPESDSHDGVYRVALTVKAASSSQNTEDEGEDEDYGYRSEANAVVSLSDIGLSAKQGRGGVTLWATSLSSAKPLGRIHARVYSNKNQLLGEASTDDDGLAHVAISGMPAGEHPAVILAERTSGGAATRPTAINSDAEPEAKMPTPAPATSPAETEQPTENGIKRDLTWLDLSTSAVTFADADTGGRAYLRSGYEAFVYTDRGVYRPGETVHLRAIVRGPDSAPPGGIPIRWQLRRPDLHNWKGETAELDADGATSISVPLPTDLPTGRWSAHVGFPGSESTSKAFGSVTFQVEEFVPQRMRVAVSLRDADLHLSHDAQRLSVTDEPARVEVRGDYLFGRPVTERPATLVARIDPVAFRPAQWDGWTFGDAAAAADALGAAAPVGRRTELPAAPLDGNGRAFFKLDLADLIDNGERENSRKARAPLNRHRTARPAAVASQSGTYAGPWRLVVTASVTEAGGRAVTATQQKEVDRADAYIGIRSRNTQTRPGISTAFELAMVLPDGSAAKTDARTIEVSLYKQSWNESVVFERGYYRYLSTRLLEPVAKLSPQQVTFNAGAAVHEITPPEDGEYVLVARDAKTGFTSSLAFIAGQGAWEDTISREKPEKLDLVVRAAQSGLAAGPAEVIIRSPFAGQLLLSVETDDVMVTRVYTMPTSHGQFTVDIPEAARPNAYVTATVVRPIDPDAKWRTHRAIGTQRISLAPGERRLNVALAAPKEIRPVSSLDVGLLVTDSSGRAVPNAAVTVAAVDEGICQLTNFPTPNPLGFFHATRALAVHTSDVYSQLMPEVARPDGESAIGGDGGSEDDGPHRLSPVTAPRFKPVALWSGVSHTDAEGVAHVAFAVPQFTGQLRVMAVASAGKAFGSAAEPVFVRAPLLVQSSFPRFAAPGDRFTVPFTVFNSSTTPGEAKVSVEWADDNATSPLEFAATKERRLELPPFHVAVAGQVSGAFDVVARERIGAGRVRLLARMNDEAFEEEVDLPVRPASPEITIGGYATATPGHPCSLELPGGMLEGTARTRVRVTPAPLLELPKGLEYLDRYPYGCVEQTTSTLFPLVYLPELGTRIAPDQFDRDRVADKVQSGITRLIGMQTADGGLAMWPGLSESWPWASVYAAHFLVEAKAAGHEVPPEFARHLMNYIHELLNRSADLPDTLQTQAYACYVLALSGHPDRAAMSRMSEQLAADKHDEVDQGGTARFDLAAAWMASGRRDLATGLLPASIPTPREGRVLDGALSSPARDRAILLSTLLTVSPEHPAITGLVTQLAKQGRDGGWRSTQDVAFAVMALGRYIRQSAATTPYEAAELLTGESVAAHADANADINWVAPKLDGASESQPATLRVQVSGAADTKGFVTWTQNGVPLHAPANADHGMQVRRRYLDMHEEPLKDDRALHSGDLVIVELLFDSTSPLQNIVIEDLLPAGLEVENPRLASAAGEELTKAPARKFTEARLDVRDDRIIVVGNLPGGKCIYRYLVRATSPGVFVVPPVKAECMYDLGTSSIGGSGRMLRIDPPGSANIVDNRGQ